MPRPAPTRQHVGCCLPSRIPSSTRAGALCNVQSCVQRWTWSRQRSATTWRPCHLCQRASIPTMLRNRRHRWGGASRMPPETPRVVAALGDGSARHIARRRRADFPHVDPVHPRHARRQRRVRVPRDGHGSPRDEELGPRLGALAEAAIVVAAEAERAEINAAQRIGQDFELVLVVLLGVVVVGGARRRRHGPPPPPRSGGYGFRQRRSA